MLKRAVDALFYNLKNNLKKSRFRPGKRSPILALSLNRQRLYLDACKSGVRQNIWRRLELEIREKHQILLFVQGKFEMDISSRRTRISNFSL